MAQSRLDLQELLLTFVPNVYFQPPDNIQMTYPCIVYRRDNAHTNFADDKPYNVKRRYSVTVIDRDPDSDIIDKVEAMPLTIFNRFYVADGLNHDVYNVFF